jgi:Putative transposase
VRLPQPDGAAAVERTSRRVPFEVADIVREHVEHCIVSGGGLTADGRHWRRVRRRRRPFLFPVRVPSVVFRAKYLSGLDDLQARGHQLRMPEAGEAAASAWSRLRAELWRKPWVVYSKPPFGGPERVLKYLSRYTHRIAISNQRLSYVGQGVVRFRYKDYADAGREKEMTLGAREFLRRFLLHVLPKGFMRVRHYGILANYQRRRKLARARELLAEAPPTPEPAAILPDAERAPGSQADDPAGRHKGCPVCGGEMATVGILAACTGTQIPDPTYADSS